MHSVSRQLVRTVVVRSYSALDDLVELAVRHRGLGWEGRGRMAQYVFLSAHPIS